MLSSIEEGHQPALGPEPSALQLKVFGGTALAVTAQTMDDAGTCVPNCCTCQSWKCNGVSLPPTSGLLQVSPQAKASQLPFPRELWKSSLQASNSCDTERGTQKGENDAQRSMTVDGWLAYSPIPFQGRKTGCSKIYKDYLNNMRNAMTLQKRLDAMLAEL